jgi:hypothetical protein
MTMYISETNRSEPQHLASRRHDGGGDMLLCDVILARMENHIHSVNKYAHHCQGPICCTINRPTRLRQRTLHPHRPQVL